MHEVEYLRREDKTSSLPRQHHHQIPADTHASNTLLHRLLLFGGDKHPEQRGTKPRSTLMEHLKNRVKPVDNLREGVGGKPQLKVKPVFDIRKSGSGKEEVTSPGESTDAKRVSVHQEALDKFLQGLCDSESEGRGVGGVQERKESLDKVNNVILSEIKASEGQRKAFGKSGLENGEKVSPEESKTEDSSNYRRFDLGMDRCGKDIFKREFDREGVKLKVKLIPEDSNGKVCTLAKKEDVVGVSRKSSVNLEKNHVLKNALIKKESISKITDEKDAKTGFGQASKHKQAKCEDDSRKTREAHRKVSFKVNKPMGNRRKPVESRVVLNSSVANLATRYNSLVWTPEDPTTTLEGLMTSTGSPKKDIKVIVSRRNSTKRDPKRDQGAGCIKKPEDVCIFNEKRSNISITYRPAVLRPRPASVKAAIQMFEKNSVDKDKAARTPTAESQGSYCVETKTPLGTDSLVRSRKTLFVEGMKVNNLKTISTIREGEIKENSKDRRRGDIVDLDSPGFKKTLSKKEEKYEDKKMLKDEEGVQLGGCLQAKGSKSQEVSKGSDEVLTRKAVSFEGNMNDLKDNSTTAVKNDKARCIAAKGTYGEISKSTGSVNGSWRDSGGSTKPQGNTNYWNTKFGGQKQFSGNTSSKVSNSDPFCDSKPLNVPISLVGIKGPKSDCVAVGKQFEKKQYSKMTSEGPKGEIVKPNESIKEAKRDSAKVNEIVSVNRSGSGVKYGGIKVLPNKSSLFSLLDKDFTPRDVTSESDVSGDVDSASRETPLCVTHDSSANSKDGSTESVNGHLNKNLEQEAAKDKQIDDGVYEEVAVYKKTKTTASKISGLAKKMMSFPKSTTKDQKSELKSNLKSISNYPSKEDIKPNTSFLWGTIDSKPKVTEQPDIELTSDQEDEYDDVYPPEFYGYVDDENIYDDVGNLIDEQQRTEDGSLRPPSNGNTPLGYEYVSSRNTYHESDNIYDDLKSLKCDRSIKDDCVSISNCYESIYDGDGNKGVVKYGSIYDGSGSKGVVKYDSAGSTASTKSFCELNNSLYSGEGPGFHSSSVSQASTASAEELAQFELRATSDCSATSDEWMDLEVSDCEMEAGTLNVVVHDRVRCGRSPSWAQRVRRQWSSRTPTRTRPSGGESSESDTDHHYEMLYEVVRPTGQDIPFDDFDSDNSDDNRPVQPPSLGYNASLPQPPVAQYGISKMAEAAGNKLLKIRKSLSRMRQKRHTTEIRLTPAPSLSTPPTLTAPLPPLPPPPLLKSTSSRNLPNRKYWSLRKFRRSTSACIETSTFYLTDTVDVDSETVDNPSQRQASRSPPMTESPAALTAEVGSDNGVRGSRSSLSSATSERRSSARPNSPPPLPPQDPPKRPQRKDKRSDVTGSTTSWYAECGLFDVNSCGEARRTRSNTWYADIGLWNQNQARSHQDVTTLSQPGENQLSLTATSQPSLTDTSLTSQPDTSLTDRSITNTSEPSLTESSLGTLEDESDSWDETSCVERRFTDEPLYQFYTASVVELARRGMTEELDSDGYEEVPEDKVHYSRPTAMELIPTYGQHRTLWCEIPEVINSCVMDALTTHQKKLQEAKFEIISSEASYIKSLTVLEQHFMGSAEFNDETVLSKSDRRILFGNVAPVKLVSQKFLADLEKCWQNNVLLSDICDVVYQHATHNFNPYVKYCSNQIYLDRTLRRLKDQHSRFAEVLSQLEASPVCQSLSLHSFLMLPMQRVTRLPLLVDAMLTRLAREDDEYHNCTLALARLNKVVKACNEGARKMERMEEILILSHQLDFPKEVKAIPIISSSRWLVRSGELTQLTWRGDGEGKLTFGKKFSKTTLHVFLFTDLLVVTKKKSDDSYSVVDYCQRNLVQLSSVDGLTHLPVKFLADGGKNIMLLTLLHNCEKKTVEMVLACSLESDRQRWMQAMSQPLPANPEESIYEHWDCPQVATLHQFVASQPDELALDVADVVNVLRKTPDGWYYGQRIRDGEMGWFPGNYATEIASAHVRAKNLKLRYRLLALSGNFLDSQRREKK